MIGDFVFTLEVLPELSKDLDRLFAGQKKESNGEFFAVKQKCSIRLEENAKKAARLTKQFAEYFGPEVGLGAAGITN